VFVTSAYKGLDALAHLAAAGLTCAGHRSLVEAARRLAAAGISIPPVKRTVSLGRALVWPISDRARLGAALRDLPARNALCSGLATERHAVTELGADHAIAWSAAADRDSLLDFIARSGARDIAITGAHADAIAAAIGPHARRLGPPRQMTLFAAS
jgi:hypothetical protein